MMIHHDEPSGCSIMWTGAWGHRAREAGPWTLNPGPGTRRPEMSGQESASQVAVTADLTQISDGADSSQMLTGPTETSLGKEPNAVALGAGLPQTDHRHATGMDLVQDVQKILERSAAGNESWDQGLETSAASSGQKDPVVEEDEDAGDESSAGEDCSSDEGESDGDLGLRARTRGPGPLVVAMQIDRLTREQKRLELQLELLTRDEEYERCVSLKAELQTVRDSIIACGPKCSRCYIPYPGREARMELPEIWRGRDPERTCNFCRIFTDVLARSY